MSAAMIPLDIWTKIVFAAKESDDYRLRALIEQAVAGAKVVVGDTAA